MERKITRNNCLALLFSMIVSISITYCNAFADSFGYVPNSESDNVSVINLATNSIIKTIPVGDRPIGVAVNPLGTKVYIANTNSKSVSVIDTSSNIVTATIPVGDWPLGVAVSPDNARVYVANMLSSSVSVIDAHTNIVITTIPVGGIPEGLAITPDGRRVYVPNGTGHYTSVIDTSTNTVIATTPGGEYALGVAINPPGTVVYIANRFDHNVFVIDATTNSLIATIPVVKYPIGIVVNPMGTRVYVVGGALGEYYNGVVGDPQISVIDTATNTVITNIPLSGGGSAGVSITPDGKLLYVARPEDNNVSVIDTAANTVILTISVGNNPRAFGNFICSLPKIHVSPTSLDFGEVVVGSVSNRQVTVTNEGSGNLTIGTISLPYLPFRKITDNCLGQILPPGAGCTITYQFSPTSAGSFFSSSNIPSNDSDENPVTISLNGVGVAETVTAPNILTGPMSGLTGVSYSYTTGGSTSSFGHTVQYQFDWKGDGSDLSPWGSATRSKTWTTAGTYSVKVRARCATDPLVVSSWSGSLSVNIRLAAIPSTVATNPSGLQIIVDGSAYSSPHTFSWTPGSSHTLSVISPQSGTSGTRYVYSSWSDGGAQSHTITAPSTPTNYTAYFTTQYVLTTSANPTQGTIAVNPIGQPACMTFVAGYNCYWYDTGKSVTLTASPYSGYTFRGWSEDLTGTENAVAITMDGPKDILANFSVAPRVINLPRTGQSKCYDSLGAEISCMGTEQDGELKVGVAWPDPRFTVSGDCVTDNLTGLMWSKNGNLPNGTRNWQGALNYVASINSGSGLCGYKDWRLPNINEFESLVNAGEANSATWLISQGFSNVESVIHWTSTTLAHDTTSTLVVGVWGGGVSYGPKSNLYYVWPVRSGQFGTSAPSEVWRTGQTTMYAAGDDGDLEKGVAWPSPRFTDNGNGTVTDNLTGLMWPKNANLAGGTKTWQEALDYVKTLNTGGHSDWRLPNRKEIFSLIDHSKYNPPLPVEATQLFQNVQFGDYWSSTTYAGNTSIGWFANMVIGYVYISSKSDSNYVWPVRSAQVTSSRKSPGDFDGDGKTDITIWRPENGYWYIIGSSDQNVTYVQWGADGDIPAVWRPSRCYWYIIRSSDGIKTYTLWGSAGDIPVPGDYDGDGKTDIAVWRPSNGYWYIIRSSDQNVVYVQLGAEGDIPVSGDFDGDGKTDIAVWRPSTGSWYIIRSSDQGLVHIQWGGQGDIPVFGDFDGDGKTDIAVWRPSRCYWYIIRSSDGIKTYTLWGAADDIPVPGDYDGDGKTDIAIWRPSNGYWYIIRSSDQSVDYVQWGGALNDIPISQ
jgi:YVTN family beta-propeller protein